jgi:hypothetical protein
MTGEEMRIIGAAGLCLMFVTMWIAVSESASSDRMLIVQAGIASVLMIVVAAALLFYPEGQP